jgi:hypothetical protein
MLERQAVCRAFDLACAKTGKRIAARIAMIAITTNSSINVKPARRRGERIRNIEPPGDKVTQKPRQPGRRPLGTKLFQSPV